MVSEPVAIQDQKRITRLMNGHASGGLGSIDAGGSDGGDSTGEGEELGQSNEGFDDEQDLEDRLEELMDELGLKGDKRVPMRNMPPDKKRQLIAQHQQSQQAHGLPAHQPLRPHKTGPEPASTRPSSVMGGGADATFTSHATLPSFSKRFSLASVGWLAEATPTAEQPDPFTRASPALSDAPSMPSPTLVGSPPIAPQLTQQSTGWWWSSKPQATGSSTASSGKDGPAFYVKELSSGKLSPDAMHKHIIALRVTLGTAKIAWIKEFIEEDGLGMLEGMLKKLVIKSLKG